MKAELLNKLEKQGFKVYPRGAEFLVYYKRKEWGVYSERELASLSRDWNKPLTKPRMTCKTPRPGCPCCDAPRAIVKDLDKRAKRRLNKRIEQNGE
jgi:hypothetical protein